MTEDEYIKKASRLDAWFKFQVTVLMVAVLIGLGYLIHIQLNQASIDTAHIATYDKNISTQIEQNHQTQQLELKADADIKGYVKCIALTLSTTPTGHSPNLAKCETSIP